MGYRSLPLDGLSGTVRLHPRPTPVPSVAPRRRLLARARNECVDGGKLCVGEFVEVSGFVMVPIHRLGNGGNTVRLSEVRVRSSVVWGQRCRGVPFN